MSTTLDLARSLNLIETIYFDGNTMYNNNYDIITTSSIQQFKYIIVIDFEATCWDHKLETIKRNKSEIIEFPAILMNVSNGMIESEFHHYVLPIESNKLSKFCTKLTGITQDMVDNGMPLQTVLMLFNQWLEKLTKEKELRLLSNGTNENQGNGPNAINTVILTWSNWDLGDCLKYECIRKSIKKPICFNQWIDLKFIYRDWYGYRPKDFNDALKYAGLEFVGREHSGIDDSRNIAKLTYKMIANGAVLKITSYT